MSLDSIQNFIEAGRPWVDHYGLWIVALVGFAQCMPVAGSFTPGFAVMLAAGYFVASGTLLPHTTLAAAWTGALLGLSTSFALGRYFGGTRQHSRMQIRERLAAALQREGPAMLLWYLYASPIRLSLPYMAGAIGYRWRPWLLFNALGVIPWMLIQLGVGYLSHGVLSSPGSPAYWALLLCTTSLSMTATIFVTRRLLRSPGGPPLSSVGPDGPAAAATPAVQASSHIE